MINQITVKQIIEDYLDEYEYVGLYKDKCFCTKSDLIRCGNQWGCIGDCKILAQSDLDERKNKNDK